MLPVKTPSCSPRIWVDNIVADVITSIEKFRHIGATSGQFGPMSYGEKLLYLEIFLP